MHTACWKLDTKTALIKRGSFHGWSLWPSSFPGGKWKKGRPRCAIRVLRIFRISEPPRESWVALSWIDELTLNATCVVDHVYPQPAVEMSLVQVALRPRQTSDPSSPSQIGGGGGGSFVQTIKT